MSVRFRYIQVQVPHAIPTLGGSTIRPRPVILVTLVGPKGAKAVDALVDSGSDDSVFPQQVAVALGIDLTNAPTRVMTRLQPFSATLHFAQLRLLLTDGKEFRDWPAWVAFTLAPLAYPTLGFAGCLQFFTTKLYGDSQEVELEVNALYPGH